MVLIGVLLIIGALAVGLLLFLGTGQVTETVDVAVLGGGTVSLPPLALFVTGMVVMAVFWFGWFLLRVGTRRSRRRRHEAREAERLAEERRAAEEQRMRDEVAARELQLEQERRRHEEREAELRREADERAAERHAGTGTGTTQPPTESVAGPEQEPPATPAPVTSTTAAPAPEPPAAEPTDPPADRPR